ncbi:lactate utilization protein C [Sideroxyarcus emersonii]|uniref:Lactate utilization protein C n=1 Tax=Sideroxyarcus emersonii TaxID=2764705 RepID=A0AAN2BZJ1_9PROT|nr:lactate utilization protein C [Sideroxyarcus emersonii]BCK88163.1 lactate utilization protein C [Sideroxyarcus emersonii]
MNARDAILGRIRNARSDKGQSLQAAAPADAIASHLARHPRGPAPAMPDDLPARFRERALKLSSDVLETADRKEVPALLARYLNERKLPPGGVCWPSLIGLPWSGAGLDMQSRPARDSDLVGVTGAFCAIAETGTLMLLSGAETPATTSLLPETHVAVIDPRRIVATMEDAWDLLRRECKQPPRAVNFVSGPSRTADIEQTVTLGAHGPYRVLLILAPAQ